MRAISEAETCHTSKLNDSYLRLFDSPLITVLLHRRRLIFFFMSKMRGDEAADGSEGKDEGR